MSPPEADPPPAEKLKTVVQIIKFDNSFEF